ncbi:MAG: hypothetical protein M1826_005468 [Phylliscum demangeonii]|nr:MAG: hypothetical protein M1826_005468 [Phylliscum demangeonii]
MGTALGTPSRTRSDVERKSDPPWQQPYSISGSDTRPELPWTERNQASWIGRNLLRRPFWRSAVATQAGKTLLNGRRLAVFAISFEQKAVSGVLNPNAAAKVQKNRGRRTKNRSINKNKSKLGAIALPIKPVTAFIESIPGKAFYRGTRRSWLKDQNLPQDLQGPTTGPPQEYNLQVQVNANDMSADQIREALIEGILEELER